MSSLKHLHAVKRIALEKMVNFDGPVFNPFGDNQKLIDEGIEEAADSYNYAKMEESKILAQLLTTPEQKEIFLKMLDDIQSSSLMLGVQWLEYEQALKEVTNETSKSD